MNFSFVLFFFSYTTVQHKKGVDGGAFARRLKKTVFN